MSKRDRHRIPIGTLGLLASIVVCAAGCRGDEEPACCSGEPPTEVFADDGVHRVAFTLTSEAWDALSAVDRPEVHAGLTFDGLRFPDVGLRLKGAGSYDTLAGKPAFNVDLNQWIRGTKLQGLKAFRLHNGRSWDPTMVHEWLAYALARDAGLLAPRVGFTVVAVNDQPFGLYVLVEKHDDVLLGHRDPAQQERGVILEPTGVFRDLGIGALAVGGEELLLQAYDEGPEPPDPAVLAAVLTTDELLAGEPSEAAVEALFTHVARARFLDYMAWEAVVQQQDGYRGGANWRLFIDGTTYLIEWVASGADSTWTNAVGGSDVFLTHVSPELGGRALRFCLNVPSCRRSYAARVLALVDRVERLALARRFAEISAVLAPCLEDDPRSSFTDADITTARTAATAALTDNLAVLRSAVLAEYPDLAP